MLAVGFLASEALQRWRRQSSAVRREQIDEEMSEETRPSEGTQSAQSSAEAKSASDEALKPEEKLFGLRTLLEALQVSELVTTETIEGPFQLNPGEQAPLVCFQFKMSHFVCKVYLAAGAEEGTRHLKLQTIFEDNRNSLIEEHRYFMANEWNSSKPYTRLQCGSRDRGQTNVFTLEYDLLCPVQLPHYSGVHLLASTLRMWYTSMMACVLHIVAPRDLPFATHTMIVENTLSVAVREEDGLQNEACPICLENFQVGDKVRRLPCMHLFHVVGGEASLQGRHCNIDRHLVLDKQCPICKTPIDIMEQVERDGAQRAQPAVQPGTASAPSGQPATPAPVEETQAEVSRPAQSPAAESQEEATQQTGQSEAGLPEQAAELERVVRSLQSRWLQIQDVVAGVQQMLHYIEDSQSALSAVRENAAAMTRTGDPLDPPAEQLEEVPDPPVPAETAATEVATQRPAAPGPDSPQAAAREAAETAAREAVQAATATTSDDRQVPMEAANWQPFTMAEKVCNAYTWRRRRLGMLKEMAAASSTTS